MVAEPLEQLRTMCLSLPEAVERTSHGEPAWFVGKGPMFATYADHHHDDRLAVWCAAPPGRQEHLIALDPVRYFRPPYVGHRGWLGIYFDVDVHWNEVADLIEDAYRTVAPRRLLERLDSDG